jgi:putative flippase GtrA
MLIVMNFPRMSSNNREIPSHSGVQMFTAQQNKRFFAVRLKHLCSALSSDIKRFFCFCLVGGSGVLVDTTILFILADPRLFALNVVASKACAAEIALINNFLLNDLWTFHKTSAPDTPIKGKLARFLRFNLICGVGIILNTCLLKLQHYGLGVNLYLANLISIFVVTIWNYSLNSKLNWAAKSSPACSKTESRSSVSLISAACPAVEQNPTRARQSTLN